MWRLRGAKIGEIGWVMFVTSDTIFGYAIPYQCLCNGGGTEFTVLLCVRRACASVDRERAADRAYNTCESLVMREAAFMAQI